VIAAEIEDRLEVEPFEPFCIELLTGRRFNVFDPRTVSVLFGCVYIAETTTYGWRLFPFHAIALIENLIDDFASGAPRYPDEEGP
jgi:hypothetical protein